MSDSEKDQGTSGSKRTIRKRKKITEAEWQKIKLLFELGEATQKELSEIFDTTQVTIANGLKARGAVRNSKAHLVGEAALEAAKSEASKRIEKVENMKDQYIKYANFLAQIMMKAINEKVQDRRPVSDAKDEVITIQKAAAALETLRSSNYHLYGLNDPDQINEEIPDMILTEMTADEIEEINRNFENIDGGNVKTSSMEIEDIEVELPFDEGDE